MDRGAVVAALVGVGMAMTVAISFLLVIPIEPAYVILSVPSGLVIGYYANARAGRSRGAWRWLLPNGVVAGIATGLTFAALLLGIKALFFFADNGYPDYNRTDSAGAVIPPTCATGADCTYHRYLEERGEELAAAGVTDAASFSSLYWSQQWSTAASLLVVSTIAAIGGAVMFGVAGPRGPSPQPRALPAG